MHNLTTAVMEHYPSAADEIIRNIAQVAGVEVLEDHGFWRIVRLPEPGIEGAVLWVVNPRGFLWEPATTVEAARAYLTTDEAIEASESQPPTP